jgi:hypothetical protein
VTTSRRPERIDEVPIAVDVLDADEFAAKHVRSTVDFPPYVPGCHQQQFDSEHRSGAPAHAARGRRSEVKRPR